MRNTVKGIKKTCSKCGEDLGHRVGIHRYCNICHAAYMRSNRPKHSELPEKARMKANARAYAKVYLKRGKIKKESCIECKSDNSQMHHADYSKPLEVIWMCRPCHLNYHNQHGYA